MPRRNLAWLLGVAAVCLFGLAVAQQAPTADDDAAYEAGILAGDALLKIDGKSTETMRVSEAVDLIQGDPGQKITLTVRHDGGTEETDVEIVRAEIKVQTVLGDLRKKDNLQEWDFFYDKDEKIGYIRLTGFNQTSFAELKAALDELEKAGVRGL